MKREGRQHGMVKTYPILSNPRPRPDGLTTATTAGLFTRVPTKPTNHSKFTGKCGRPMCRECHSTPASKSKDKAKGAQRLRSFSNATPGLRLSGFSATSVLDYLDGDDCTNSPYRDTDDEKYSATRVEDSNCEIGEVVECEAKNDWIDGEDDVGFGWQIEDGDEDWYLV